MMWSKIVMLLVVPVFALTVTGQSAARKGNTDKKRGIDWKMSLQSALQESKRTNKPIMVDFWATWCAPCRAMVRRTYTHPIVLAQAKNFVMVKIDIEKFPEDAGRYDVETPPKVIFLKSDGSVIESFVGFRDAAGTVRSMKSALSKLNKKDKVRAARREIFDSFRMRSF